MREILFRGQTRRYGEKLLNVAGDKMPSNWVYGGICKGDGDKSIIYGSNAFPDLRPFDKHVVYTDTVGQYTGLYDATKWEALSESEQEEWLETHTADEWKGTKIFEGDIVEAYKFGEEKHINIITFKNGCFWFGNWTFTEFLDKFRMHKVIGNIHDNPDILKSSENL